MTFGDFYHTAALKYSGAYEFGLQVYAKMIQVMQGGPGAPGSHDYGVLAECVRFAGSGDYLEIGSAFGCSAILAALVKKKYDLPGKVTCIDPLNGGAFGKEYDPAFPNIPIIPETIQANAELFGVRLEIIRAKSEPFPIKNRRFAMTYIDGWHLDGQPLRDWEHVREVTDNLVVFHDYDPDHPHVVEACKVATGEKGWMPVHVFGNTFALMRKDLK